MQRTHAHLLKKFLAVILLAQALSSASAFGANDFWYWFGDRDIDYFSEGKKVKDPLRPEVKPNKKKFEMENGRAPIREYDRLPFDWADYDDQASPVFFDEGGDYVPPRPLQMLVANPTPENAERVKRWQQKKLQASMMLARLLNDDAEQERREANIRWRDVGLYYFYGSSCSVCKTQAPIIKELEALGVQVTPIQVDYKSAPATHPHSLNYDEHMKKAFEVNVTPTFAIFGKSRSAQWEGYSSLRDIKSRILKLVSNNPT